jgi:predicted RNA-binding protein YlxR (DUF448 family)
MEGRRKPAGEIAHHTRQCIACRVREQQKVLLRLVWSGTELRVDREGSFKGRGAYVHERLACVQRVVDPKRWEHAFRLARGTISNEALGALLSELRRQLLRILPDA